MYSLVHPEIVLSDFSENGKYQCESCTTCLLNSVSNFQEVTSRKHYMNESPTA